MAIAAAAAGAMAYTLANCRAAAVGRAAVGSSAVQPAASGPWAPPA